MDRNGGGGVGADPRPTTRGAALKEKITPAIKGSLLISIIINLITLGIGLYGLNKCPVNENIPIFLAATGGIGLLSKLVSFTRDYIQRIVEVRYVEAILYIAETVLTILGVYWVLKEYKPSYEPDDGSRYCNKTVYLYAFINLIIFLALAIAIVLGFCCFLICSFFVVRINERDLESQQGMNPSARDV